MIKWAHTMRICIVITVGHMYASIILMSVLQSSDDTYHPPTRGQVEMRRCSKTEQPTREERGTHKELKKPLTFIQGGRFSKQLGHFCCYLLLYLCGTEILMTAEISLGQARESKQLLSQSLNVSMRSHVIKDNQHTPPSPPFLKTHFFTLIHLFFLSLFLFFIYDCIMLIIFIFRHLIADIM